MGRQEKPLADPRSPQGALAAFLRALRIQAELTYTDMGAGAASAVSTLSQAAGGATVPSLQTVRDYVTACRLDEPMLTDALTHAEVLWRKAVLHSRGITHPAGTTGMPDDRARTPGQFAEAVTALLGSQGLFAVRDIEDATARTGHRIPRSTLARLLNRDTKTLMSSTALNTLLDACGIHDTARRRAWTTARTNTALATAGLDHTVIQASDSRPSRVDEGIGLHFGDTVIHRNTVRRIANAGVPIHRAGDVYHDVIPRFDRRTEMIISPDGTSTFLDVGAVTRDLELLCRGRGVYTTPSAFGPALLTVVNRLTRESSEGSERRRLITLITNASAHLPAPLRTIFLTAASISAPDAKATDLFRPGTSSLHTRLTSLAMTNTVDERTIRRRLHDAAQLLAEQLLADYNTTRTTPTH